MKRYDGRVAIVTGAATGIGRAMTERLLEEGALVVANDLKEDSLETLRGDRVITVAADVSDPETADLLVNTAFQFETGRIDTLFNNAGITLFKPAEEVGTDEWNTIISVNLNAVWYVASAVGKVMISQRGGSILNTASGAGIAGITNAVAYTASKHGVVGLTRALSVEWGRFNIRVNALAPGYTLTPQGEIFKAQAPEIYAARRARVPLHRPGLVDEQAAMALFLNSDDSSYTSGLIAVVDGGTHALSAGFLPSALDD